MKSITAMNAKRKQSGFTIIELVVVILLLGILTATALPRFMDVTDEAHTAVVDALVGGMVTGNALFRAQWVAEGQPLTSTVSEFSMFASTGGYPKGTDQGTTGDPLVATACLNIYDNLLQTGRPTAASFTPATATAAAVESDIETAASSNTTADVLASLVQGSPINSSTTCNYYYVGQHRSGTSTNTASIPMITYNFSTGVVSRSTITLNTD